MLVPCLARAAPPILDALYPAGARAGTEVTVQIVGKADPWPPQVWCDTPAVTITPSPEKGKLQVRIAPDAVPGPCLLRLHNAEGASAPRIFVAGTLPEFSEGAENNAPATPEALPALPVVVNGRLDRTGDTDFFRVRLAEGELFVARIDAYGLGSPVDPFLHLLNLRGDEIALASIGRSLDPILAHRVDQAGDYLLQVSGLDHPATVDVSFSGSEKTVYRLTVATGSEAVLPRPEPTVREVATPSTAEASQRQLLPVPARCEGALSAPGERDRYRLTAAKDQRIRLQVLTHSLTFTMDPVLRVTRPDGREFRTADDPAGYLRDPEIELVAPLAGDYMVELWDRFGRGGPGGQYQIVVEELLPDFSATTRQSSVTLKPGGTANLPFRLERRQGHAAALTLRASGLPPGVTLEPLELPAKTGEVNLTLKAAADAAPASQPFQLEIAEAEAGSTAPQSRSMKFTFQTDESRGPYLLDESPWLWIAVAAVPSPG